MRVERRLRIAYGVLSVWPWSWTLFFYFAGAVAAYRLGHWPTCCVELAKYTLPEVLSVPVKLLGLFGPVFHLVVLVSWVVLLGLGGFPSSPRARVASMLLVTT